MKLFILFFLTGLIVISCKTVTEKEGSQNSSPSVAGTWKLITGTLIEKGDTSITDYTKNVSFIKIINDNHFAFLQHDLHNGKDSSAVFSAGGGSYTLKDSSYTEHLEYCNDRAWEGHDFTFTISIINDTLTQYGLEKIEGSNINRLNIEKYSRVK